MLDSPGSAQLNPRRLAAFVKRQARQIGFDLVGITTPDPPPHLDVFRDWLAQGRHGEMKYLATERSRERRADPRKILPGCRSILVVGANYLPASGAPGPDGPIAAYAVGKDYHPVLLRRLEVLVAALEEQLGQPVEHRIYVDTGPLLERELGQRAGLGWIGKNSCLIHPERGSYFFLAEVLLGIPLQADPPFAHDRCGSCTRCIQACPTDCILPDRTLDASRCISYLTIELRGSVPSQLRSEVGGWIFGCDICQQVCPWNQRFAQATQDPAFQPDNFMQSASPENILDLDEAGSQRVLDGSALSRAKRSGLLRNAAVAAGNSGDRRLVPPLIRLLASDPAPEVRSHAAWALGRLGGSEAVLALQRAGSDETDPAAKAEIKAALILCR